MTNKKILVCRSCGRMNVRFRSKKQEFVCIVCGDTWKNVPALKAPENTPLAHPAHPNGGKAVGVKAPPVNSGNDYERPE